MNFLLKTFLITFTLIQAVQAGRYYNSEDGRFISRDPLGYEDGMSLYNAYFAEQFALDPYGLKIEKTIEFFESDVNDPDNNTLSIKIELEDNCKGKVDTIVDAIQRAQKAAYKARNNEKYRDDAKWFGNLNDEQKKKVQETYDKTYAALVHKILKINCEPCQKGDTAARVEEGFGKGVGTVTLYPKFFVSGVQLQLKIIFHEYTHIGAGTHDKGYRTDDPNKYTKPGVPEQKIELSVDEKLINADTYTGSILIQPRK